VADVHPRVRAALRHVPHRVHRHADLPGSIGGPADLAAALGYSAARVARTLLVRVPRTERYALVVAPADERTDLRAVASALAAPRVEIAPRDAPIRLLDYPPAGVSPLGVRGYPVFASEALQPHPTVLVGAGAAGVEVELTPADLLSVTGARVLGAGS